MKKIYLLSSVFILTLLLSGITYAEVTSTGTRDISELKQKVTYIKQQALEDRIKIKTNIASTTANVIDIKQDLKSAAEIRIGKKLDEQKIKITDNFEKTIKNLEDLDLRIDSRISKMESENIDASTSKSSLEITKTKLALAETELKNLEISLAEDIPPVSTSSSQNEKRKVVLNNIKLQSEKTKMSIMAVHDSMVNVVHSLRVINQ